MYFITALCRKNEYPFSCLARKIYFHRQASAFVISFLRRLVYG